MEPISEPDVALKQEILNTNNELNNHNCHENGDDVSGSRNLGVDNGEDDDFKENQFSNLSTTKLNNSNNTANNCNGGSNILNSINQNSITTRSNSSLSPSSLSSSSSSSSSYSPSSLPSLSSPPSYENHVDVIRNGKHLIFILVFVGKDIFYCLIKRII